MKDQVFKIIKEYDLISENDNIVVGLSGGPDSMALLHVLLDIKSNINFNILIAHVNHGVRGKEALEDERFVEKLASKLKLPYYSTRVNMDEYAREKKISSEEAGRDLRYGFFRQILHEVGGGKIAVAHNKNDQAETLLMRFFRGTGIDGLVGMEYKVGDVIRPILGIERIEIEKYLLENNIETRLDKTNLEPVYSRNRVRLELIPYIEKYFNPNIVDTLWRTSKILSIDNDFLEKYSKKVYNKLVKKKEKNSIILNGSLFLQENRSVQQRIIRNCFLDLNGHLQGVNNRHILDTLTLFLERGTGKSIDLSNNIVAKTSYNDFIVEKKNKIETKDFLFKINFESYIYIDELQLGIRTKILPKKNMKINTKDRFVKYFDYDKIVGSLYIRNRRDGDRFVPYGMKGSKKVKDYFIDEKVPKEKRDRIPLIVDEENILWIVGYRTSEIFKITNDTKNILMIELIK